MERRQCNRSGVDPKYKTTIIFADEVTIKDIGLNGICVMTSQRLHPNKRYSIELISNNEKIAPTAEVVRCFFKGTMEKENETLPLYEVGLKFVNLNESERHFLEEFISKQANKTNSDRKKDMGR